jgi:amino acid transporter
MAVKDGETVGLWGVVAIGIGGMVGGGIFAVLGLSVEVAKGGAPLAFFVAGLVALLTARSYALLSRSYPSRGGTVTFLNEGFGAGLLAGGLNVLMWLSYIVMLSLYSEAFGSYAASLVPAGMHDVAKHGFLSGAIVLLTVLNLASASTVARAERYVVVVKIAILLFFVAVASFGVSAARLAPSQWASPLSLVAGGMIIFLAYEGFELIANTAEDVEDPGTTLPRAYFISVLFVIALYVLVALVSVGSVARAKLVDARDYALAVAARPALGSTGFRLIAVAAMLSTASAINATLYGSARVSFTIATSRELPARLERKVWNQPIEGLLITAAATLVLANVLDLASISTMGSAGFLIIFAGVNAAEARTSTSRGSRAWISVVATVACIAALAALIAQSTLNATGFLLAMVVAAFAIEATYRHRTGRHPDVATTA